MKLFELFKGKIYTPEQVLTAGIDNCIPVGTPSAQIKKNFSRLVFAIQGNAYAVYLKKQKQSGEYALEKYLTKIIPPKNSAKETIARVAREFENMDKFFLSIAQSRKARAGGAFEDIIKTLFKKLDYPFEEQQIINGKPDFLMPSKEHFDRNAMDCIIFTAKRTLRERWRQIVTEGTRGLGFFLATIDAKITSQQLKEIKGNRIYLVLPASMKKSIKHYAIAPNVISFESFFKDYLDPALKRWKKAGLIQGKHRK